MSQTNNMNEASVASHSSASGSALSRGIIIYALGHRNYLSMAITLAVSIKHNDPDVNIALLASANNIDLLQDPFTSFFSHIIEVPADHYMVNGQMVFNNAMMHMYQLSPFDCIIKLDADMIMLPGRKMSELFEDLKDVNISFENKGYGWNEGNCVWADEDEVKKKYRFSDDHKLYKIYGEFVYFRKSKQVEKFFNTVHVIYKNPKVTSVAFANGTMTDELAYQIACMKTEMYPHEDDFTPVYNIFLHHHNDHHLHTYQLAEKYYALSIGGNQIPKHLKVHYNNLASFYFNAIGLQSIYNIVDKKHFLPERIKL